MEPESPRPEEARALLARYAAARRALPSTPSEDALLTLASYIDDRLPAGERAAFERRLQADAGLLEALEQARLTDAQPAAPLPEGALERALATVRPRPRWRRLRGGLLRAAALLLALVVGLALGRRGDSPQRGVASAPSSSASAEAPASASSPASASASSAIASSRPTLRSAHELQPIVLVDADLAAQLELDEDQHVTLATLQRSATRDARELLADVRLRRLELTLALLAEPRQPARVRQAQAAYERAQLAWLELRLTLLERFADGLRPRQRERLHRLLEALRQAALRKREPR